MRKWVIAANILPLCMTVVQILLIINNTIIIQNVVVLGRMDIEDRNLKINKTRRNGRTSKAWIIISANSGGKWSKLKIHPEKITK